MDTSVVQEMRDEIQRLTAKLAQLQKELELERQLNRMAKLRERRRIEAYGGQQHKAKVASA
jgi:hypothetical protein